jgi:hypothetical protein
MISKDDYILWKNDPLTQAWFEACQQRIEDGKETLAGVAGLDPIYDSYVRGIIKGYSEMMNFTVEDFDEV